MIDLKIPQVNIITDDECMELTRKIAKLCGYSYKFDSVDQFHYLWKGDDKTPYYEFIKIPNGSLTLDQAVAMLKEECYVYKYFEKIGSAEYMWGWFRIGKYGVVVECLEQECYIFELKPHLRALLKALEMRVNPPK